MNKNAILRKVNKYPEGAKIAKLFPAIAGGRLAECKNVDADCLRMLILSGNNEELTLQFLIDSYVIATKEGNSVLTEDGAFLGRMMGGEFVVSENALELFSEEEEDIELDSHKEQYEDYDGYDEDTGLLEGNESTEVLEDEGNKEVKEEISADEKQIMQYYSAYYNGVVQELLKRYNAMFSSGYQLQRPAGILTIEGIVKLSGSERVIGENSVSTYNIYNLVKSNIGFTEYPDRSITNIANILYNGYQQGSDLLYFPNKMLEFAFGVESPKSDNQNSLKNYNKHSKAKSW